MTLDFWLGLITGIYGYAIVLGAAAIYGEWKRVE